MLCGAFSAKMRMYCVVTTFRVFVFRKKIMYWNFFAVRIKLDLPSSADVRGEQQKNSYRLNNVIKITFLMFLHK